MFSLFSAHIFLACREVDLGPFKHKIDDGLELRKAAFECMDVLLERCKDCINMGHFITHLEQGLQVPAPSMHLLLIFGMYACRMSCASLPTCLRHACPRISGMHANMLAYVISLS